MVVHVYVHVHVYVCSVRKLDTKFSFLFWIGLSFFCTKILAHAKLTMVTMVKQCFVVISLYRINVFDILTNQ